MNDSKVVAFFLSIKRNLKAILIITAVITIVTMVYLILQSGTHTSSCTLSVKLNENFVSGSVFGRGTPNFEAITFSGDMLDGEALSYVESIKSMKYSSGRTDPYNENLLDISEYYLNYFSEQDFFDFLAENSISRDMISVDTINGNITIRTFSNEKGESYELLMKAKELVPRYIEMKCRSLVEATKKSHESLLDSDVQKLSVLISQYKGIVGNDMNALEERRRILNEYATVAADYDVSYSVIKKSEDILASDITPQVFVKTIQRDSDSGPALIFAYLIVSVLFAFVVSVVYIYVRDFIIELKKTLAEVDQK